MGTEPVPAVVLPGAGLVLGCCTLHPSPPRGMPHCVTPGGISCSENWGRAPVGGGLRSCRPMRAAGTRVPPQPEVVHRERGFMCTAPGVLLHPPVLREGWSGVPSTPAMGDTSLGGTVSSSKGTEGPVPLGLLCGQEPAPAPVTLRSQTLSWPLWDPAASLGQFGGISAPPAPAFTHGAWQDGGAGPCPELPRSRGSELGLLGQGERRLGGLPPVSDGPCGVVQRTSGSCQRCPEAGHEALDKTQSPGGSAGAAGSTGGAG